MRTEGFFGLHKIIMAHLEACKLKRPVKRPVNSIAGKYLETPIIVFGNKIISRFLTKDRNK